MMHGQTNIKFFRPLLQVDALCTLWCSPDEPGQRRITATASFSF